MRIFFTDHFFKQWNKRVENKMRESKIKYIVRKRAYHAFRQGVKCNKNGDFEVMIFPTIFVVLVAQSNGFVAVTAVRKHSQNQAQAKG